MLFDTHMHFFEKKGENISEIINNAVKNNVKYVISNSISLKSNYLHERLIDNPNVMVGFGIYPEEFNSEKDLLQLNALEDILEQYKNTGKIVVGEIGLDFKDKTEKQKEIQEKAYVWQINYARDNKLYVEVHSRYAVKQTLELLVKNDVDKAIMHWYTISRKYIKKAINEGYFITLGPSYLYNHDFVFDLIKGLPPEYFLFETDYPVIYANKLQTPEVIKNIALQFAQDFELEFKDVEKLQEKNFKKIFKTI